MTPATSATAMPTAGIGDFTIQRPATSRGRGIEPSSPCTAVQPAVGAPGGQPAVPGRGAGAPLGKPAEGGVAPPTLVETRGGLDGGGSGERPLRGALAGARPAR